MLAGLRVADTAGWPCRRLVPFMIGTMSRAGSARRTRARRFLVREQALGRDTPLSASAALDFFNGLESTRPMWEQLDALVTLVQKTIAANPAVFRNGWIGMGHSQGLVCVGKRGLRPNC